MDSTEAERVMSKGVRQYGKVIKQACNVHSCVVVLQPMYMAPCRWLACLCGRVHVMIIVDTLLHYSALHARVQVNMQTWSLIPVLLRCAPQGRIASFMYGDEPLGPPRVWLKDINVPGLCMTRSFGDSIAATVGVIDVPEVLTYTLKPEDR